MCPAGLVPHVVLVQVGEVMVTMATNYMLLLFVTTQLLKTEIQIAIMKIIKSDFDDACTKIMDTDNNNIIIIIIFEYTQIAEADC